MILDLNDLHRHMWNVVQEEHCESAPVEPELVRFLVLATLDYLTPHIKEGEENAARMAAEAVMKLVKRHISTP